MKKTILKDKMLYSGIEWLSYWSDIYIKNLKLVAKLHEDEPILRVSATENTYGNIMSGTDITITNISIQTIKLIEVEDNIYELTVNTIENPLEIKEYVGSYESYMGKVKKLDASNIIRSKKIIIDRNNITGTLLRDIHDILYDFFESRYSPYLKEHVYKDNGWTKDVSIKPIKCPICGEDTCHWWQYDYVLARKHNDTICENCK